MHPALKALLDETITIFQNDPRVLAAYYFGSVNRAEEDDLSDADVMFVIRPESFEEFDRELPPLFAKLCPQILLWWPERFNREDWKNYAILFKSEGALLQYDLTFMKPPGSVVTVLPEQFIFDKAGLLNPAPPSVEEPTEFPKLRWTIEMFWIFAYITAKYLKRGDIYKLLYAQEGLREAHFTILRALNPTANNRWWPKTAQQVAPAEQTADILLYFGANDVAAIARVVPKELDNFSRDARLACGKWQVEYPASLEERVRGCFLAGG